MLKLRALLLLLALALPAPSWAVVVSRCWSPDGPYVATADHATKCPPRITSASAIDVTDDTATITVTTTGSNGTLYVYMSTSSQEPTKRILKAGTGALYSSNTAISAPGTVTFAVPDLSAETQYYAYALHESSVNRPSNRPQIAILTEAASGPPATTVVAGYFWGTGGSDFNAGTSHAARWASLEPYAALSGVANGTDVWGLAGSTHAVTSKGKVTSKWAGAAGDPAILGCYYRDGSTDTACWEGSQGAVLDPRASPGTSTTMGSLELPYIDGALTDTCIGNKNCSFLYPIANECSSFSDSIVKLNHAYVHLRGMRVGESTCRNITLKPTSAAAGIRIIDSIVEQSGAQATVIEGQTVNAIVKRSIYREAGKCSYSEAFTSDHALRVNNDLAGNCSTVKAGHSGGLVFSGVEDTYSGITDVTFVRSYSEGMQCFGSTKVWMRGVRAINLMFAGIYLDACKGGIVESSWVSATNGDVGQVSPDTTSITDNRGKLAMSVEPSNVGKPGRELQDVLIRNNFFPSPRTGLEGTLTGAAKTAGKLFGAEFYHNTIIGARERTVDIFNNLTAALVTKLKVKNNLFGGAAASAASRCFDDPDTDFDYNLFGFTGVTASCQGINDPADETNPGLVVSHTSSAWAAHSHSNLPDPDDAKLVADTNTGARLNNVACISAADQAGYLAIASEMDYPYDMDLDNDGDVDAADMTEWGYCAKYDFFGNVRGNTPNIGFHEF